MQILWNLPFPNIRSVEKDSHKIYHVEQVCEVENLKVTATSHKGQRAHKHYRYCQDEDHSYEKMKTAEKTV